MKACRGLLKSVIIMELAVVIPMLLVKWRSSKLMRRKEGRRPHIVFFLGDDMGWKMHKISSLLVWLINIQSSLCSGYNDVPWNNPNISAPNLLKLAQESTILSNYYTYSSGAPSRASLLTGILRERHRMSTLNPMTPNGLNVELPLMPEYFKAWNYSTHLVGKWVQSDAITFRKHLFFLKKSDLLKTNLLCQLAPWVLQWGIPTNQAGVWLLLRFIQWNHWEIQALGWAEQGSPRLWLYWQWISGLQSQGDQQRG